jgi:hypothetical protein
MMKIPQPTFYRRLREELNDEEFIELLQMPPSMATNFGLTKKQFHQLKEYCHYQGMVF